MVEEDFEIWYPGIQFPFYKESQQSFFDDPSDILFYGSYKFTTTKNESFNTTVYNLVPKRTDFRSSYSAITAIVIGRTNRGEHVRLGESNDHGLTYTTLVNYNSLRKTHLLNSNKVGTK